MTAPFKQCSMCKTVWESRADFLNDPAIEMIGYQPDFDDLEYGLFYFNHNRTDCNTTLSFNVHEFSDMYHGPIYQEHRKGAAECPGFCLQKGNLEPCPVRCACAYIRNLMQLLAKPAKAPSETPS